MTDQLQRYQLEKQITLAEYDAALMFWGDYAAARDYLRDGRTADRAGAERYREACRVLGDLRPVVLAVVVDNLNCSSWAAEQGASRAVAVTQLRTGLGRLVGWYARQVEA